MLTLSSKTYQKNNFENFTFLLQYSDSAVDRLTEAWGKRFSNRPLPCILYHFSQEIYFPVGPLGLGATFSFFPPIKGPVFRHI